MSSLKDIILRYEEAKLQEKRAQAILEELKPILAAELKEDEAVKTDRGTLYLQAKRKFTYSELTQEQEKALKEAKKREEADGTAQEEQTFIVVYKEDKQEESAF
jgi:hypothetical protein